MALQPIDLQPVLQQGQQASALQSALQAQPEAARQQAAQQADQQALADNHRVKQSDADGSVQDREAGGQGEQGTPKKKPQGDKPAAAAPPPVPDPYRGHRLDIRQ